MRRRGKSPWLEAEKTRVRTTAPMGVAHRIASGETAFYAWRVENATPVKKMVRETGIPANRLDLFEMGYALPHPDELEALAKALRVTPEEEIDAVARRIARAGEPDETNADPEVEAADEATVTDLNAEIDAIAKRIAAA
jgi:transcriptional regulator with XRE-family HTH domain